MKKIFFALLLLGASFGLVLTALHKNSTESTPLSELKKQYSQKTKPSVEHSLFPQLKKKFTTPQQVTAACISCHNGRAQEVMHSSHWNWERTEYIPGKGIREVGKRNVLNNFCIGITSNEQHCAKCHVGFGYADTKSYFSDSLNVDCLACHDNSNTYMKASEKGGLPDTSVNLSFVAQHVGKPTRENCGVCHFYGGGNGNNVKHGDLEEVLFDASRDADVHMASSGANMQCVDCHTAQKHQMLGKLYSVSSMNRNRVECEQCHGTLPHNDNVLNDHTLKVACQACHIPMFARVSPTEMYRDWSTAGKLKDGKLYQVPDSNGNTIYNSEKGSFVWAKNVKPEYIWFNGTASHYLLGDTINPAVPVKMNELYGSYGDPDSKIIPVKIHRGKQIYDTQYDYLIQPETTGDDGFFKELNWEKASEKGMKAADLPFSGKYGFVETEMYWPVNHMIPPKEQAVSCTECHTRDNSRLANLKDFYMPGRDYDASVELFGKGILLLTLAGVVFHGGARIVMKRKKKESK
jgi:octaheme c-type cytochrome (tetrathionate reductase family)